MGLAVLLSGCTADPAIQRPVDSTPASAITPPTPIASPYSAPTPSPTLTAGASGLIVVAAAASDTDPSHPPYDVIVDPSETLVGHYTNYRFPVQIPHDDGPTTYAEGRAVKDAGEVVAYEVAPGDIYDYVAKRFHLTNNGYLLILNEPRRGEAPPLYAGDVLNLSARTLNEYGTVNGRVAHGPQPVTAPEQET